VDPRCLAPFDTATVFASVRKTNRVVIVEEAAKDVPIPFSPPLEEYVLPQVGDIVAAVRKVIGN
jgi:pyruvate dehydrogenase E1 component beta subunit